MTPASDAAAETMASIVYPVNPRSSPERGGAFRYMRLIARATTRRRWAASSTATSERRSAEVGDEVNAVDTVIAGQRPTVENLSHAGPAPYRPGQNTARAFETPTARSRRRWTRCT